jgi:hypothetical protein
MWILKCLVLAVTNVHSRMQVFILENGTGRVTLDHMKAGDHVRTVLNNRKRQLPEDDKMLPVSSLLVCVCVCVCMLTC